MANPSHKLPGNVPGPYFTDVNCAACLRCAEIAPANIGFGKSAAAAIVYKQPVSPAETAQLEQALVECPHLAIGRNGAPPPAK